MTPFLLDLQNQANNTDTQTIKGKLAQSGARWSFLATTILSEGRARLYICPHHWEDDLLVANPNLNDKFFAFEGELIHNIGHTAELKDNLFHLQHNSQTVPTIHTIVTALAPDTDLELMGP